MTLSWRDLESRVGLEALPAFHRAFLAWRGVQDPDAMPLRRVQQRVEAELNRIVQAGLARRDGDDWQIDRTALEGFAEVAPLIGTN